MKTGVLWDFFIKRMRSLDERKGWNHTIGYTYDKDSRETKTTLDKVTRETAYDAWGRVKAQD